MVNRRLNAGKVGVPVAKLPPKDKEEVEFEKFKTPGPSEYDVAKADRQRYSNSPAWSIKEDVSVSGDEGDSSKPLKGRVFNETTVSPGPVYNIPPLIGNKSGVFEGGKMNSPMYSLSGRPADPKNSNFPGPGAYKTIDASVYKQKSPNYSLSGRTLMPGDHTIKPGPGAHSPEKMAFFASPNKVYILFERYFGKYLNKYEGNHIPVGWLHWMGLIMNTRFYNYSLNINGAKVKHGDSYEKDYFSDLIVNDSLAFLRESRVQHPEDPVMLVLSFPAPHGPEDSAPQYSHMFFNVTTHHTPSYDFAPNADKQWLLQVTEPMEPLHKKFTDILMTKRLQTLLSVDDGVEKICNTLKSLGELDNTYIFYTSDHGYHLGQFGLLKGKSMPFEFDTRVPFFVRGPGIQPGSEIPNIVLNIDLAPTFLDIAGVLPPSHMDGKSFYKVLLRSGRYSRNQELSPVNWRDTFLIERGKPANNHGGKAHSRNGGLIAWHSKKERVSQICSYSEFQGPCKEFQKWTCFKEGNRWRMKKCRSAGMGVLKNGVCICDDKDNPKKKRNEKNEERQKKENLNRKGYQRRSLDEMEPASSVNTTAGETSYMDVDVDAINKMVNKIEMSKLDDVIADISTELFNLEHAETEPREILSSTSPLPSVTTTMPTPVKITEEVPSSQKGEEVRCQVTESLELNCSSSASSHPIEAWHESKAFLDEQIDLLKEQLSRLKTLRKSLKKKRPDLFIYDEKNKEGNDSSSEPEGYEESNALSEPDIFQEGDFDWDYSSTVASGAHVPDEGEGQEEIQCVCDAKTYQGWMERQRLSEVLEVQELARKRLKAERKAKKERRLSRKRNTEACNKEKVNCFSHDNDHWKTPPYWNGGPLCACINANNNTYACLRTINDTHNILYCEFQYDFVMFFNLNIDPFQLRNIAPMLSEEEEKYLHSQLEYLHSCKGAKDCTVRNEITPRQRAYRERQALRQESSHGEAGDGRAAEMAETSTKASSPSSTEAFIYGYSPIPLISKSFGSYDSMMSVYLILLKVILTYSCHSELFCSSWALGLFF
ncbi:unnamed protein product [Darwinula stevensoni]|uniref:Uncharacterized protein n=1 Tax=Darwinula stevensoni TaxID=69355 RepID=A0A7R8XAC3_9CRUS|nr:unnamed protein product [Darwinula stevensoni]CAG0883629.1 unnamed protein product [Darwinula stevensoni]